MFGRDVRGNRVGVAGMVILAAGMMGSACVADPDQEEKPEAPDISEIVNAFDNPTAPLNEETATGLLEFANDSHQLVEELDIEQQVLQPIYDALEEEYPGGGGAGGASGSASGAEPSESRFSPGGEVRSKSQAITLEGDGFVRVTRICEGWEEPVVDEDKNGSLRAIIGFTDSGLDPVMWGNFQACRYVTSAGDVLLEQGDGDLKASVALHIGESMATEDFGTEPILFVLNLDSTIDGERQEVQMSFRINQETGLFELLYETPEGSLVLLMNEGSLVGVRALDGEYSCDAEQETCVAADEMVVDL